MRRLLYLAALSMVIGLVFAPAALAQQPAPTGIATAQYQQYTATAQYQQYTPAATPTTETALPSTGGIAPLLIPAAGLLLGAGLIGIRMIRRS